MTTETTDAALCERLAEVSYGDARDGETLRLARARIEALDAEVERLKKALEPFARFASRFGETAREDSWVLTNNPSRTGNLTMGDVRAARAALGGSDAPR